MRNELIELFADLYDDEDRARTALFTSGYPKSFLPKFTVARSFWQQVIQRLEQGVVIDGLRDLLAVAVTDFPANEGLRQVFEREHGARTVVDEATTKLPPPELRVTEGPCPTLLLIGLDKSDEFEELVRTEVSPDAELLYVSREQCAVRIPDPGSGHSEIVNRLQQIVDTWAPGCQVVYEHYSFRPYLYRLLFVYGPDGTPYELRGVPATTLPEDIAAAVVQQSPAMTDRRGGVVRTVIDHETGPNDNHRLDPQVSLHEAGVKDQDSLRVGAEATAGAISPVMRMRAQKRVRAQIRRYAQGRDEFHIDRCDNEDLPNRFYVSFEAPGFAPPENIATFLYPDLPLQEWPFDELAPVPIIRHALVIYLPPMFPIHAPVVVWETDVFHPNIWRSPSREQNALHNQVCLGALMDGYRPDLDFGSLCQTLVDIGSYQNYDVVDADTWPDPVAAFWAKSSQGQAAITAVGGKLIEEWVTGSVRSAGHPRRLLWISPLEESGGR